jgi:hypothetical protein
MPSTHPKRDVTIARNTLAKAQPITDGRKVRYALTALQYERLDRILTDIDARTGKRDPHVRRTNGRRR